MHSYCRHHHFPAEPSRRGIILVLAAVCMIMVFAFVAFTIDVGYMANVKSELQLTADAAATGSVIEIPNGVNRVQTIAKQIALLNPAGGSPVPLSNSQIELGKYDLGTKAFVPDDTNANAVRVTATIFNRPTFIAGLIGQNDFDSRTQAVAILKPRDIVFVVDLSGSMNDDTEPCWATSVIDDQFGATGAGPAGSDLMVKLYSDLGFGSFPGAYEYLGEPLGVEGNVYAYAEMTKDDGALTDASLPLEYRIFNDDDELTRKQKAYSWIIDNQLARLMPNARPTPSSASSYAYYEKYLDYVINSTTVGFDPPPPPTSEPAPTPSPSPAPTPSPTPSPPPPPPAPKPPSGLVVPTQDDWKSSRQQRPRVASPAMMVSSTTATAIAATVVAQTEPGIPRQGSTDRVWLPPSQDGDRITDFNNPNHYTFPSATNAPVAAWRNHVGYVTYVQFMQDWGRDRSPEEENSTNADPSLDGKTQLSTRSPYCRYHSESTPGGNFNFPPAEQPMHAVRRSLIAAISVVKRLNTGITPGYGDRVSIVTFDASDDFHTPQLVLPLSGDYQAAMSACTTLQPVSDIGTTTATEIGMRLAREHLKNASEGGQGRKFADKVMILLSDGVPNAWESTSLSVDAYISGSSNPDFYGSDYIWYNAPLMQADIFRGDKGQLFGVGMGLGADYDFMDRIARTSGTDDSGVSPRGSANPAEYEKTLTKIFEEIIKTPGSRLVQ